MENSSTKRMIQRAQAEIVHISAIPFLHSIPPDKEAWASDYSRFLRSFHCCPIKQFQDPL